MNIAYPYPSLVGFSVWQHVQWLSRQERRATRRVGCPHRWVRFANAEREEDMCRLCGARWYTLEFAHHFMGRPPPGSAAHLAELCSESGDKTR